MASAARLRLGCGCRSMVETHRSFCRLCHALCGIEVDGEDGRVLAVRGDRTHVVSQGYLCVKGRALAEQHTHPARIRGARKRMPDERDFEPISGIPRQSAIPVNVRPLRPEELAALAS